jgi:hypothetical protein
VKGVAGEARQCLRNGKRIFAPILHFRLALVVADGQNGHGFVHKKRSLKKMKALIMFLLLGLPSMSTALHLHSRIKKSGFDEQSGFTFKIDVKHNDNGTSDYSIRLSCKPAQKDEYFVPDFFFPHDPVIRNIETNSPHRTVKIAIVRTKTAIKSSFTIPTSDIPLYQWAYEDAGEDSTGGIVYDIWLADFAKTTSTKTERTKRAAN